MQDNQEIRDTTDFGFTQVSPQEKTRRVKAVFSSVAGRYDLMNDLMSAGMHRLWKRFTVHLSQVRNGDRVLDLAGGTGDMALLFSSLTGDRGRVVVSDINDSMLHAGRDKLLNRGILDGIDYVQANAESLPFAAGSFDCISMAFGLRNVTHKERALASIFESLDYGGVAVILEFSTLVLPVLRRLYDNYSFRMIPEIGRMVAGDRQSYQYLVESIRRHPDQETLKQMMEDAGFAQVCFYNLFGGIVAVHRGYKI